MTSAERKGKARPLEPGRGTNSPPANPERVTAGALEHRKRPHDDSAAFSLMSTVNDKILCLVFMPLYIDEKRAIADYGGRDIKTFLDFFLESSYPDRSSLTKSVIARKAFILIANQTQLYW